MTEVVIASAARTAIGAFKDGLAPAQKAGKIWGYIDSSGVMKIPVQFEGAQSFSEGRAAVQQGRKWGRGPTGL